MLIKIDQVKSHHKLYIGSNSFGIKLATYIYKLTFIICTFTGFTPIKLFTKTGNQKVHSLIFRMLVPPGSWDYPSSS